MTIETPTAKTLKDVFPREFMDGSYDDVKAFKYKDCIVVEEYWSHEHPWVGKEKNVHYWCVLDNMIAVGWNENPARGWSFPVKRLTTYFRGCYGCNH